MNKLKSIKLWVTVWCLGLITYAIIADKTEWSNVIMALAAVPISYSYFNVKQKEMLGHHNDDDSRNN